MFAIIIVLIVFCFIWWYRTKSREDFLEAAARLQNDKWGEYDSETEEKEIIDQKIVDR